MNIAFIDDDVSFANTAINVLKEESTLRNIPLKTDTFQSGEEFINNKIKYDLILLDIGMPEMNGFELFRRIQESIPDMDFPYVVFVSAKDHLVFEAMKMLPYSFVRKIDFELDIGRIVQSVYDKISTLERICEIQDGRTRVYAKISSIIYLEKEKNYIVFHTTDGLYRERGRIESKEKILPEKFFIRINTGCVVNSEYILRISRDTLHLKNGDILPISRSYKNKLIQFLGGK